MADRTDNVLRAAIRSLEQVVLPAAAASGDPMAKEQAGLVIRHLRFLRERGPLQHERSRFELDHHLRLARRVGDTLAGHDRADEDLDQAVRRGDALAQDAGPAAVETAAAELRGAVSRVVRCLFDDDPVASQAVDDVVLDAASEFLDFERAWFLPQGWDPDEAAVPPLHTFLAGAAGDHRAEEAPA